MSGIPYKISCEEHDSQAIRVGWDSDGTGIFVCVPGEHGLLEDGVKIGLGLARTFVKESIADEDVRNLLEEISNA